MMDADGGATIVKPLGAKGDGEVRGKPLDLAPFVEVLMVHIRHRVSLASIRTLFSCIGVGEAAPFTLPHQSQALARLRSNVDFFLTNYLLVTAVVFFFLLLFFHPIQLFVCIIVACAWYGVLTKKHSEFEHLVIMGKRITEQEILLFTTASTIIFLVFFILPTILFSLSTSSLGCALHAFFRNNRLKDESLATYPQKPLAAEVDEELV